MDYRQPPYDWKRDAEEAQAEVADLKAHVEALTKENERYRTQFGPEMEAFRKKYEAAKGAGKLIIEGASVEYEKLRERSERAEKALREADALAAALKATYKFHDMALEDPDDIDGEKRYHRTDLMTGNIWPCSMPANVLAAHAAYEAARALVGDPAEPAKGACSLCKEGHHAACCDFDCTCCAHGSKSKGEEPDLWFIRCHGCGAEFIGPEDGPRRCTTCGGSVWVKSRQCPSCMARGWVHTAGEKCLLPPETLSAPAKGEEA